MLTGNYARQDRRTHEIVLHISRIVAPASGFRGDALLYRIVVSRAAEKSMAIDRAPAER